MWVWPSDPGSEKSGAGSPTFSSGPPGWAGVCAAAATPRATTAHADRNLSMSAPLEEKPVRPGLTSVARAPVRLYPIVKSPGRSGGSGWAVLGYPLPMQRIPRFVGTAVFLLTLQLVASGTPQPSPSASAGQAKGSAPSGVLELV